MRKCTFLCLLSLCLYLCGASYAFCQQYEHLRFLKVGEATRSYLLYLPKNYELLRDAPMPLVIALHGANANAWVNETIMHLSPLADRRRFILVHPNGSGPQTSTALSWNAGNCCSYAYVHKTDDVTFIRQLIHDLKRQYNVDSSRVMITGFSNGAKMAYRLACQLSDMITIIGPVGGTMEESGCSPQHPVSVVAIHGTADEYVPYEGGIPEKQVYPPRVDDSVRNAIRFWARHNGCTQPPHSVPKGKVTLEHYKQCVRGTSVALYTLDGGRHVWPVPHDMHLDLASREVSASKTIIDFMVNHPRE